jgi:hypothetical protein
MLRREGPRPGKDHPRPERRATSSYVSQADCRHGAGDWHLSCGNMGLRSRITRRAGGLEEPVLRLTALQVTLPQQPTGGDQQ